MKTTIIVTITLVFAIMACKCGSDAKNDGNWKTIPSSPSTAKNAAIAPDEKIMNGGFTTNLPAGFQVPTDDVGKRMLKEYGALFVARGGATPPSVVVFKDAAAVS